MLMQKIAVVVLNFNGMSDTISCLKSLCCSKEKPAWIILVDNASNPAEQKALQQEVPKVCDFDADQCLLQATSLQQFSASLYNLPQATTQKKFFFILAAKNKGYSSGNNLGMTLAQHLGADAVWLLNNDTVVAPDALTHMRERLFSSTRPGLCGSLIRYMAEPDFVQCLGGGHTNRWTGLSFLVGHKQPVTTMQALPNETVEKKLNFIYGASVMVSRNFLATVGLLDESYFMYCEEQDWAFRAANRFDLVYSRDAHVWHKEGASTGWPKKANNFFAMRHLFQSRLLLTVKHTPAALPIVLTSFGYALVRMIYRRLLKKNRCVVPGSR